MDEDALAREEDAAPPGQPAEVGARLIAGAFDLAVLGVIGAVLSLAPMVFGGFALPLLGAMAAIVGYSIVPQALFKATLGMRIFGLEIVGLSGRAADLGELAFRELVGRGMFGAAYFATVAIGIAGYLSRSMAFFSPTGVGLALFFVSGFLLLLAAIGHLMIVLRPDGRGFPDLIARTMVVKRGTARDPADALDLDEEEKRAAAQKASGRVVKFAIFCVVLAGGTVTIPYLLSRPSTGAQEFADRVKLASAEKAFNTNPRDSDAANEFIYLLQRAGDQQKADEVRAKHSAAIAERERVKEAAIRASLARDPKDWDTFSSLIELLEEQERTQDARTAFEAFLAADPTAENRAAFGIWLYQNNLPKDAVATLEKAIAEGVGGPNAQAYLGFAYQELGDKRKARAAFKAALAIDPELEQVQSELESLDEQSP